MKEHFKISLMIAVGVVLGVIFLYGAYLTYNNNVRLNQVIEFLNKAAQPAQVSASPETKPSISIQR